VTFLCANTTTKSVTLLFDRFIYDAALEFSPCFNQGWKKTNGFFKLEIWFFGFLVFYGFLCFFVFLGLSLESQK